MASFNTKQKFVSGSTRSDDTGKLHFERALSPLVLERFVRYMYEHNVPAGRHEDQWQLGIPMESYTASGWRHFFAWWKIQRGFQAFNEKGQPIDIEEALCGLMFNVQGFLHEFLKRKQKRGRRKH